MNSDIEALEPKVLWENFIKLNAVPRPSKKEERVVQMIKDFGAQLSLETLSDEVGNVLIKKPATPGMENRQTVVLQAHLDMVHQKNADTNFDFLTQGIEMFIEDDWVKAKGTTLGADNGIGVATIMATLASDSIPHPAIEAIFTIDEETGMTGAKELKTDWLTGSVLLNLDTEEDDEIGIGCAGGVDFTATLPYTPVPVHDQYRTYELAVRGLQGGHSGMDIIKGLGNANKIMNRLLHSLVFEHNTQIQAIQGGSLRNAIPRESFATIAIPLTQASAITDAVQGVAKTITNELLPLEKGLQITLEPKDSNGLCIPDETAKAFVRSMYAAHNGVYTMSLTIPGLVATSNNIAKVTVDANEIRVDCLVRSSIDTEKQNLVNALTAAFELSGFTITTGGDYPGWEPNPNSELVQLVKQQYEKINGSSPEVLACHAGLECGILGEKYPEIDMVSFGPTIKGAHSPDERVSIPSVQKYWTLYTSVLENIPERN